MAKFSVIGIEKKAMPRELLDDHFRRENHLYSYEELWQLSNEVLNLESH